MNFVSQTRATMVLIGDFCESVYERLCIARNVIAIQDGLQV